MSDYNSAQHPLPAQVLVFFFFNDTATTEIYTLSLHDALPISAAPEFCPFALVTGLERLSRRLERNRSEEHTSELQSRSDLVCRLLLEKKRERTTRTVGVHELRTGDAY